MRDAPGFPGERDTHVAQPEALHARGITLRAAQAEDLPWLHGLYASTRTAELAGVPWSEAAKRKFLDQQFALQHAHYLSHFADADFLLLETPQERLGRLYLQRAAPRHVLVDISLMPAWRGRGIGGTLIAHLQLQAAAAGCGLSLHVLHANPQAQRLYARLGFVAATASATHLAMDWDPLAPLTPGWLS